jgi:ligand-binding sensor domain-containing protein
MKRSFKLISLLLILAQCGYTCMAQGNQYIFTHLKEKDGLSYNIINSFLKDSRGFLWIGTFNGLNRYDGTHFYNYKRTKDSLSLPDNTIHGLCEDKQGNIWGATDNGIFSYSITANKFRHYTTPNTKGAAAVQNILCDRQGEIWATGMWTVLQYNKAKDAFEEIGPLTTNQDSLSHYSVRKNGLVEDPSANGLWLATRTGLHFYNKKENKFHSYKNQPGNEVFTNHNVAALTVSAKGQFWVFDNSTKQVIGFDPKTKRVKHKIELGKEMSTAFAATIFEDSNGMLWLSTWNHGTLVIDYQKENKITRIEHEESNSLSIAGTFFWCAYEDEDGTVWLGTSGGISKCNATKTLYKIHSLSSLVPEFRKRGAIVALTEDPRDKSWWIASHLPSVIHYFPATGTYQFFDLDNASPDARNQMPWAIGSIRLIDEKPIICTQRGSWVLNSPQDIKPYNPLPPAYQSFIITSLTRREDIFYFADQYQMLSWNSKTDEVINIGHLKSTLDDGQKPLISYPIQRSNSKLWMVAGVGWLAELNNADQLVPVSMLKNRETEQSGYFTSLDIDKQGNLWAVNRGIGLYKYDPISKNVDYWDETDGLITNNIYSAAADEYGRIWCVSNNKFSVFTSKTKTFYNFSIPLSDNNPGYISSSILLTGGNILTNIYNDMIEFFPLRLAIKPFPKEPLISMINIEGKDRLLDTEKELHLEPSQNSMAIKYGLFTDREIFPYTLEYMLEGFDKKWIKAGSSNEAVYNNLPSGTYTFRLMAKANDNSWQSAEKTLKIIIRTPFFKTKIFFILLVAVITLLLYSLYRFRMAKQKQVHELQNKAYSLEKEKALVMYEGLKQQLNPHFLFNSLTSLNSLIDADPKNASRFLDSLSKTYRYILKSRDHETVVLADEIKFAEAYISLQKTRFENGFEVNISIPEEYHHCKIVPVTLQNLIENAIKHNILDEHEPLLVEISIEDDYLVVKNNRQLKNFVEASNKQGLGNLKALYHYLSDRELLIMEDEKYFTVRIPLL